MTHELVYHGLSRRPRQVPRIEGGEVPAPRYVMLVERIDGTFNVFEDDLQALKGYRPKRGERTSIHRAFVRSTP
jgi:hypothetical protein